MTSYELVFSGFLAKITDYKLISLETKDVNTMMTGWLHAAAAQPKVKKLFSTLTFDDTKQEFNFVLKNSNEDALYDIDFVIELFSKGMVVAWLEPTVNSIINTMQAYSGKEQKFYSQANHLEQLRALLKDSKKDLKIFISEYGYINNPYLSDGGA